MRLRATCTSSLSRLGSTCSRDALRIELALGRAQQNCASDTSQGAHCISVRRVLEKRAVAAQVAERVRVDKRVTVLERTNLRYITLDSMPGRQPVQLVTLDLSFISVLKVLPAVCSVLTPDGALIVLIKPQFEASRSEV